MSSNQSKADLSNQIVILDSNNCNGLFFEDYLESLNLNVPHSLLKQCLKINENLKNEQKTKNFLLNSILVRENYRWKKSFTYQKNKFGQKSVEQRQKPYDSQTLTKQVSVNKVEFNQSLSGSGKKPTKKQQQQMLKEQQQLILNSSINNVNSTENPSGSGPLPLDLPDLNLMRKQSGQYDVVANNLLDLFDNKYSCSFLSIHEQHDLFYSSHGQESEMSSGQKQIFDLEDRDSNGYDQNRKYTKSKSSFKTVGLNVYEENKSGLNVLKRLITKTKLNKMKLKMSKKLDIDENQGLGTSFGGENENEQKINKLTNLDNSRFLYHNWMHEQRDIKSNVELTKSLKHIQPLLEETVQKKYTTANMWDSFQGPLTWQHFCRLAFKGTASNHTSSHHLESISLSTAQSSTDKNDKNSDKSSGNASNEGKASTNSTHHQHCYEPEPVPAFLVSSLDKEWMAITPYALKFWDKLNLEPYSKQKNISYIVLMPDFDSDIFDNFNSFTSSSNSGKSNEEKDYINYFLKNTTPSNKNNNQNNTNNNRHKKSPHITNSINEINKNIKDYFKELTSTYELLRLGLHRPALRIAPDSGLVKVPILLNNSQGNNQKYSNDISQGNANKKKNLYSKFNTENNNSVNSTYQGCSENPDLAKLVKDEPGLSSENSMNGGSKSGEGRKMPNTPTNDQGGSTLIDVDKWFDDIQQNQSTSLIGKNLKSYAQIFKLLATKITTGYSSTLASNIQKSFVTPPPEKNTIPSAGKSPGPEKTKTQFASTLIPTMSSINLDKSLYEELKPSKLAMSLPVITPTSTQNTTTSFSGIGNSNSSSASNSLLSNLLTQRSTLSEVILDPIQNSSSSPHTSMMQPQQQAQILTNYNQYSNINNQNNSMTSNSHSDMNSDNNIFNTNKNQNQSQQQQNSASLSQLTANLSTPPVLFVYIIDPFDYFSYINLKIQQKDKNDENGRSGSNNGKSVNINNSEKRATPTSLNRSNSKSNLSFEGKIGEDVIKVKDEKFDEDKDMISENANNIPESAEDEGKTEETLHDTSTHLNADSKKELVFNELDLKRLRKLGFFKAYLEMLNNIPDLFKYSTQFQILPLNLCMDLQQQSTSMYIQSLMQLNTSSSNYSSCYAGGFGTGCSDIDMDYKLSFLKREAFNSFALSRRYFMSPAHNFYMQLQQQQCEQTCLRPKCLTGFGPAGYEQLSLRNSLMNDGSTDKTLLPSSALYLQQMKKMNFYSPPYILAPSTIASSTVAFAASNLFFKNTEPATPSAKSVAVPQQSNQNNQNNGTGECNSVMSNFIQLNMSNSSYGHLNSASYKSLIKGQPESHTSLINPNNNSVVQVQPFQQSCNVLYVAYCLSEDQRYLLTSCCDENGELLESTSINIEIDERMRRQNNHARRLGLRKLWEFIIAVISQTCKPWRLVIGRLGRIGHSEIKGWGCLLGKKNLQRVCAQLKENCETCNLLGNMEMPSILSGCLISLETCDNICIYPEAYSKEDKSAAAALNGQQLLANHAAQAHGISCTHILTFPVSATLSLYQQSMINGMKDSDPLSKSDMNPMDDGDFFNIFNLDDEDLNDFLGTGDKGFNVSGTANEGEQVNMKEKTEALLNQEEIPHLDQQPLAVGYYISTAKCGPLPRWFRGNTPLDTNFHSFKATLHIHNRYALENDELAMQVKTDYSHKLDSSVTYEVLRYVLERYNALSWLNIDPLTQDRKSCLPIHHTTLLQLYYAFKNYI